MTDAPYRILTPTSADLPRIEQLLRDGLGEGQAPRTAEFWRWKHERSPFGPSPTLVAESDGKLVGLRVFSRWSWTAGDRTFSAVRAVDTATHPDWRGRGIFSKLTMQLVRESAAAGHDFVFNTPNDKSGPGYLKMGWSEVARVPVLVMPGRVGRAALRLALSRNTDRPAATIRPLADDGSMDRLLGEPSLTAFLTAADAPDPRLHTNRTAEYLAWRYRGVPGFQYQARYRLGPHGAAIIFRRRERKGLEELSVAELLCTGTPQSLAVAKGLLLSAALEHRPDLLLTMAAPGTRAWRIATGLFLPLSVLPDPNPALPFFPLFTVRSLHENLNPSPLEWANWAAGLGDLELF